MKIVNKCHYWLVGLLIQYWFHTTEITFIHVLNHLKQINYCTLFEHIYSSDAFTSHLIWRLNRNIYSWPNLVLNWKCRFSVIWTDLVHNIGKSQWWAVLVDLNTTGSLRCWGKTHHSFISFLSLIVLIVELHDSPGLYNLYCSLTIVFVHHCIF